MIEPMLFPTEVHPGYAVTSLPVETNGRYAAFLISPEFKNTLEIITVSDDTTAVQPVISEKDLELKRVKFQSFWVASNFENSSGKVILRPSEAPSLPGVYLNRYGGYNHGGMEYKGLWTFPNDSSVSFSFTDIKLTGGQPTNFSMDVTLQVCQVSSFAEDGFEVLGEKTVTIVPGGNALATVSLAGTYQDLAFRVVGTTTSNVTMKILQTFGGNPFVLQATVGHRFDLFDLPNMEQYRSEYDLASQVTITGMSFDLRNVTAILNKSGAVIVAEIPQGSRALLPPSAKDIYRYLSSLQSDTSGVLQLAEGASGSYFPMDLEDIEPESKRAGLDRDTDDHHKPLIVVAIDNNGTQATLNLELKMTWQYITNSSVTPPFQARGSRAMYMHMISHYSHSRAFGTSETKQKRHKENEKRFRTDPTTKELARECLKNWKSHPPVALCLN